MPTFVASGSVSQASITSCESGSIGTSAGSTAAPVAARLSGFEYSSTFTWVAGGIIIRVSGVRVPPGLLPHTIALTCSALPKSAICKGLGGLLDYLQLSDKAQMIANDWDTTLAGSVENVNRIRES